jgi:glycosyltransferase involved in cell wall biosynthesis
MASLFKRWPDDELANLYIAPSLSDGQICTRGLCLDFKGVPGYRICKRLFRHLTPPESEALSKTGDGAAARNVDPRLRINTYAVLRAFADALPIRIQPSAWEWMAQYSPELVVSPLESIRVMNLSLAVSREFNIPVVPYFGDDWISTFYRDSPALAIPRLYLCSALRKVLRKTNSGMAASPAMAEEYRRRFKKPFSTFLRTVDVPPQWVSSPVVYKKSGIIIVYAGRLNCDRWRPLLEIAKALVMLRESGLQARLDVYSVAEDLVSYGSCMSGPPPVNICGSLAPREVFPKLVQAHILVHVESFDDTQQKYTRLSLSTKIPQYLAAGRPILMYGPKGISVTEYARSSGAAVVVDETDVAAIAKAIRALAMSDELRTRLGRAGWMLAKQRHDEKAVTSSLQEFLWRCAHV